jgi:PDZ domain-containing protein
MITIGAKTFPSKGRFLLPTVVSEEATLLYCLYSLFDPDAELEISEATEPQAQSPQGNDQMALSQYLASVIALEALGYEVRGDFSGLRLLRIYPNSPNLNVLREGDILVEIDGSELNSFESFKKSLSLEKPGETFPAVVLRGGERVDVALSVAFIEGENRIGVYLRPELKPSSFPFPINFNSGRTVGASGGLVFALEIYDKLTPEDLTGGKQIAATGTLDYRGRVGAIEGIEFKIKGAQRAGVDVIIVPKGNLDNLQTKPSSLKIVPVSTFKEALDALKKQ